MGFSCPSRQLYFGLTVLGLVLAYLTINLATHPDRLRSLTLTLGATAYLYLNWKHGFIRADGHQVGFYFAALTVIVSSPLLLDDSLRFRLLKNILIGAAGLVALFGMEQVLPGLVRGILSATQDKVNLHVSFALGATHTRGLYESRFDTEKHSLNMVRTRAAAGQATVDVLGFEQGAALVNNFNYQPRPVFQGYSAYTPYLSRMNYDYYASERAPEYVLFKLQTIDGRLATMDDPHVLRLLVQRYTYQFTELGFTVWKRKPGSFNAAAFEPKPLRSVTVKLGEKTALADLRDQNVWVEIDYRFSLLGKLRRFLFRPPLVQLRLTDEAGVESVHRLPQPIGQAGFMLNPVINDLLDFMRASGGTPKRRVVAIAVEAARQDRDCLREDIRISYYSMPPSQAGINFFKDADHALFNMFIDAPTSYQALNPPNEDQIDRHRVMIMHAPSEMIFDVPSGSGEINGAFGFVPGAYSNGGKTNGAQFEITWSDGGDQVLLLERFLDPVNKINDRGLQPFSVRFPKSTGRVFLRIKPGPHGEFAYDWTGWTAIEFK
jgi:hypothetical protein